MKKFGRAGRSVIFSSKRWLDVNRCALKNGELLQIAEQQSFDVLVTTDRNLKYQQNLSSRKIAIVVLSATSWPRIQKVLPTVVEAIGGSKQNGYVEVPVPYDNQPR